MRFNKKRFLIPLILVLTLILSLGAVTCYAGQAAAANGGKIYSDAPVSDSNSVFIYYLSNKNIMGGYPDGTFKPGGSLTRAEVVTALVKAMNLQPAPYTVKDFKDVPKSHWAAGYIQAGYTNNILKGYSNGTFKPDQPVSRTELAVLLVNFTKQGNLTYEPKYPHDVPTTHWAYKDICTALSAGLMAMEGNSFSPDGPASRNEFARGAALAMMLSPALNKTALVGTATVKSGYAWQMVDGVEKPITSPVQISTGMTIRTGGQSELEITFEDGSAILLKPSTSVKVTGLSGLSSVKNNGEPISIPDLVELEIYQGKIFGAMAGPYSNGLTAAKLPWYKTLSADRAKVKVKLPWGAAYLHDAFWANDISDSQSTSVLYGKGSVTSYNLTVDLAQGQKSSIPSSIDQPNPAESFGPNDMYNWRNSRAWVVERAEKIADACHTIYSEILPIPPAIDSLDQTLGDILDNMVALKLSFGDKIHAGSYEYDIPVVLEKASGLTGIAFKVEFDYHEIDYIDTTVDLKGMNVTFDGSSTLTATSPGITSLDYPDGSDVTLFTMRFYVPWGPVGLGQSGDVSIKNIKIFYGGHSLDLTDTVTSTVDRK